MEPITWVVVAPFVGILIGIVLRTLYPLYTARMMAIKDGVEPPGFDKQYLRDWLQESGWNKEPPAPALPADVVEGTRRRYVEAYERLTGRAFETESSDA